MSLLPTIESILFVSTKPLTVRRLAEIVSAKPEEVEVALTELEQRLNTSERGIRLLRQGNVVQCVTSPEVSPIVTAYLKEVQAGELTRAALETLTIIAYRGPISKIQLDTIRGVNCALILRNLLIKGLIEAKNHKDRAQTSYYITTEFLKHLGITRVEDLPDYERLHADQLLDQLLHPQQVVTNEQAEPTESSS